MAGLPFKPIDLKELERSLGEAMEKLEEMRQRNRHFEWAIAQIVDRRDALREEFLRDAIAGRLEEDEIRDFSVYFDLPTQGRRMLMAVSAHYPGAQEKPWENKRRLFALQDTLPRQLPDLPLICLFSDDYRNILLLYDAPEGQDVRVEEALRTLLRQEPDSWCGLPCAPCPAYGPGELPCAAAGAAAEGRPAARGDCRPKLIRSATPSGPGLTDVAADGHQPLLPEPAHEAGDRHVLFQIPVGVRIVRPSASCGIRRCASGRWRSGWGTALPAISAQPSKGAGVSPADYRREEGEE